jgi:translation initiation factor 1
MLMVSVSRYIFAILPTAKIMTVKSNSNAEELIYSTHPEFEYEYANVIEAETLSPQNQSLTIGLGIRKLDGTLTTTVTGFIGKRIDLIELEQALGVVCRAGGSTLMYDVILRGDVRKRAYVYLRNLGYKVQFAEIG